MESAFFLPSPSPSGCRLSTVASVLAPSAQCFFISANSSVVSFPGFNKMASGVPTFPMSWSEAD